ncbi:MAG: sulfotransferase [Syntrophaceae bacterium]|nr:sulfotransferase [Syntrophaceae bacterium]
MDFYYLVEAFLTLLFLSINYFITSFFLFLDNIFYPGFRRIKIEKPVFIIGHPRSGTTFLHRLFTQSDEIAAFKSWHLFCPALTQRFLMSPLFNFLIQKNRTELIPETVGTHMTLDKAEEEELLFLHKFDTQFIVLALGFLDDSFRDLRFHDLQPRKRRIKSVKFLKSCFQRQIFYTGKAQIFAQMHYSTHRIKTLLEVFPDARFIYIDRTPYDTLPSYFSLLFFAFNKYSKHKKFLTQDFNRYIAYRYQASKELYQYFHEIWHNEEVVRNNVLIVPYNMLRNDLMAVYKNIVEFTGIDTSKELEEAFQKQAENQTQYKRKHTVKKIEEFGIDENRLKNDFAFYFKNGFAKSGLNIQQNFDGKPPDGILHGQSGIDGKPP